MISIIIPIYNQADKLSSCLDSILKQSILTSPSSSAKASADKQSSSCQGEEVMEIIIANDGSTDNVEKTITNYKLQITNLKVVNQENKGSNPARNSGAKEARGEYLLFCDADIKMKPNMLEIMLKTLENNPKASFVYSSFKYGLKTFKLAPYSPKKLKTVPCIHTTSLIRREHFPWFDEEINRLQDWDLWLTMLEQGHTGIWINKILFKIQGGGNTMSSWLPSFAYKLMPFLPSVKKYKKAVRIIKGKHNL